MDALTKERIDSAAMLLRNPAALIMYAVARGEDLATCRINLRRMLATGWTEGFQPTSRTASPDASSVDISGSDLDSILLDSSMES